MAEPISAKKYQTLVTLIGVDPTAIDSSRFRPVAGRRAGGGRLPFARSFSTLLRRAQEVTTFHRCGHSRMRPALLERYTLRDAKARLSEILDRAAQGGEVEIVRHGSKPGRFRILAVEAKDAVRRPGSLKGRITIGEDFDDEDVSLTAAFEGRA
ncbi:type II toxin-antitoxin system Phd/YefM family antitoxin [Rubrimonas sp.]|uniref:type II toxin-antitoxin system Phd/YefM family antitoxin n=1 Tax=Rubrimonas sp. TaxID=2036015 RepID=UPI002FDEC72E